MSDFLNQMRNSTDWLLREKRDTELNAVDSVLKFRHHASAAGYRINLDLDNIEDLFSLATALPRSTTAGEVQIAIGSTLNYAQLHSSPPIVRLRVSENRGWLITPGWHIGNSTFKRIT